jgi:DNA-binding Lrp family transcriptional regulator
LREKTFHRLLEGIRRYGLENVSTLSKWIDIPVETARYMIWEELPKHDISVGITVNLPRIGLGRWMLYFKPVDKSYTSKVESFLKEEVGLMFLGRVLPNNCCFATFGIPFGEHYKLRDQLEHLRNANIIASYSLDEIEFVRNVSFNSNFYDFKEKSWKFDWDEVENYKEPLLTPELAEDQAPVVDYKDILILKELQQSVPRTLSKLSGAIGLDQHNLRYHYKTHARRAIAGYYLKLGTGNPLSTRSTVIFMHEFGNTEAMDEGRAVALSIPFTQRIWKAEKYYCWYVSCPGEYTNGLLKYVNDKFTSIPGRLEVFSVDSESEYVSTIPYTLFDERSGNWRYEPKSALTVIKK